MDEAMLLNSLLTVWGAITLVFGALLMWKYLVGMREDNILILDTAEASMAAEQAAITAKLQRIARWTRIFGYTSLVLFAGVLAIFVHRSWVAFNGG